MKQPTRKQRAQKSMTVLDVQRMRDRGERITMLTAYDYPTAKLADEAGIPILLVGDSLGNVVLGYDSTIPVTVEDMIHHGRAVVRGTQRAHVVVDMPFGSFQTGWQDAMRNATRIMQETGCGSVKLEGGQRVAETVSKLVEAGIPVMGHVGLTPQSVNALGGHRVQGKTPREAVKVLADAKALEEAGEFPTEKESFFMDERALSLIKRMTPGPVEDLSGAERVLADWDEPPIVELPVTEPPATEHSARRSPGHG